MPDNPSAWLFRVASNKLLGALRQRTSRSRIMEQNALDLHGAPESPMGVFYEEEAQDDLLHMLFLCCDDAIPSRSQLVLALKTLCGFSVIEISLRLFTSEANTYKRLGRARQDDSGELLLLEDQNRAQWDQQEIQTGLHWLAKSAIGSTFSRYHAEAGIAAEHCIAPSFRDTRWEKVVECYDLLENVAPSALHRLNRAVAIAERQGPEEGLATLENFEPPSWLAGSCLWAAAQADLHRRSGETEKAISYRDLAIKSTPTPAIKRFYSAV